MPLVAQVAVDKATIHFDKLYSYLVPDALAGAVWPCLLSTSRVDADDRDAPH